MDSRFWKFLFYFSNIHKINIIFWNKNDLVQHVLSYGLSNLALGNPFRSTWKFCIWSISSNLEKEQSSSSITYSISCPSFRFQRHTFPWWIFSFGGRTMQVLKGWRLLQTERRIVPLFHRCHKRCVRFSILKDWKQLSVKFVKVCLHPKKSRNQNGTFLVMIFQYAFATYQFPKFSGQPHTSDRQDHHQCTTRQSNGIGSTQRNNFSNAPLWPKQKYCQ